MNFRKLLHHHVYFAALSAAAITSPVSGPLLAATAPVTVAAPVLSEQPVPEVVITGSRILRPVVQSPVPVTAVTQEDLLSSGTQSIGDALNNLPSLRSTFSQSNSTRFIGTGGLNLLDLRGLGTERTLVLVNGRRHVTSSPGDYSVDVNSIPVELLERVDVVTAGDSAIYGSDAVAGVVNFIMKRDFTGLKVNAQDGLSSRGDRRQTFVALTAGRNFADDKGNIAVAAEYSKAQQYNFRDRDDLTGAFSGRNQFNLAENTTGEPAAGNGVPDQQFFTNIRNNNISDGGLITAVCTRTDPLQLANPLRCPAGTTATTIATVTGVTYVFDPSGNLIVNPIARDLRFVGSSNSVGGLGSTLSNYADLAPEMRRSSISVLGHYDLDAAFKPFVEAKYVSLKAPVERSPSFWQGAATLGPLTNLRCDNPFLNAQAYAQLQAIGRCSATIAYGATNASTFAINRNNVDFGLRKEKNKRITKQFVLGAEGMFNHDWRYEVSFAYGKVDIDTLNVNDLQIFNLDGTNGPFAKAIDATRNAAGQIVCRVNAVTVTDPACVPLNVFGQGAPSAAAVDYIMRDSPLISAATQRVWNGYINGDSSQWFSLPGGPLRFAVGLESRTETGSVKDDPYPESGATFLTAIASVKYPALKVNDSFAELLLPVLADKPGFKQLEFSLAGRNSRYNSGGSTARAYNVGAVWSPIDDLKFRYNKSRSVRAPTQADLYDPLGQNFASVNDPCDVLFINTGSSTRAANCAAAGVPTGFVNVNARSQTLSLQQGGNPNLQSEKSDSTTIGVVVLPRWMPNLSFAVDYYKIVVRDLIASITAQQLLNNCYDGASISNQYCTLVHRVAGGDFADPFITNGPVNYARQDVTGVDFDIAYDHSLRNGDMLAMRLIAANRTNLNNYLDPSNPATPNRQLSELGDPSLEFSTSLTYKHGSWTGRWESRYIGRQTIGTYEAQNSFNGQPPLNADQYPIIWYPSVIYHDLRADYQLNKRYRFYVGIDNVGDVAPPYGLLSTTAGSGIFDNVGRYVYGGVHVNF
jgi:outer membrane receptor protein involved in Fe transport